MSTENITKFREAAINDPALQAKLLSIDESDPAETAKKIAAISSEAGVPFSADEFLQNTAELSDEALESVAGGVDHGEMFKSVILFFTCLNKWKSETDNRAECLKWQK